MVQVLRHEETRARESEQQTVACLSDGVLSVLTQLINFAPEDSNQTDENFRNLATPLRTFLLANGAVAATREDDQKGSLGSCFKTMSVELVGGVTSSGFLCGVFFYERQTTYE